MAHMWFTLKDRWIVNRAFQGSLILVSNPLLLLSREAVSDKNCSMKKLYKLVEEILGLKNFEDHECEQIYNFCSHHL